MDVPTPQPAARADLHSSLQIQSARSGALWTSSGQGAHCIYKAQQFPNTMQHMPVYSIICSTIQLILAHELVNVCYPAALIKEYSPECH